MPTAPPCPAVRHALPALAAACLLLLAAPLHAADPVWHPLHAGAWEGRPADVSLDPELSDELYTAVDVTVYGFWTETITGGDGQLYDRYSIPGLGRMNQVGAPDLPAVRVDIADGTDGDVLLFDDAIVTQQQQVVFTHPPAPLYVEGTDGSGDFDPTWDPGPGDSVGSEPQWAYDAAIYGSGATWPVTPSVTPVPLEPVLGPVRGATALACPMTWKPTSNKLNVHVQATYIWTAIGNTVAATSLTKLKDKQAALHFVNWQELGPLFVPNPTDYHARYLILAESGLWPTLNGFENHKKLRGFQVSTQSPPAGVDAIRDAIASWYQLGDPGMDHFALLVGDVDRIPTVLYFTNGTSVYSDDPYGCVGPVDASKEVSVGRLSFDDAAQLGGMLQRIIAYENQSGPVDEHDEVLLVAHEQDAPGKYVGSHVNVTNGSYSSNPTFVTRYGHLGWDNGEISQIINANVGLVAYRGHGSTNAWTDWSSTSDSYHKNNVIMDLAHDQHPPVVWSFSCTNSNLRFDEGGTADSISEVWMEVDAGAVAAYGASRTTSTTPNHELNEELFRVVYDQGVTTHAHALELAEAHIWSQWPGHHNPYAYMLLGDPSMKIRRGGLQVLSLSGLPAQIMLDEQPGNLYPTLLSTGDVITDGLVSVYKESFLGGQPDELLAARWVDGNHDVQLPVPLGTPGTLHVTATDADGNTLTQQIDVGMGFHWTDLGQAMGGSAGEPRLAGTGSLWPGNPWSLLLADALPGATAWLCVGVAELNAPFKGGVLVPDVAAPGFALPLPTDEHGNIVLASSWPAGVPPGTEFLFQYWVQDAAGPLGFVASNAVKAATPL